MNILVRYCIDDTIIDNVCDEHSIVDENFSRVYVAYFENNIKICGSLRKLSFAISDIDHPAVLGEKIVCINSDMADVFKKHVLKTDPNNSYKFVEIFK